MFKIASPGFNDSLDEYINKRKDKRKLSRTFYSSLKSKKSKESPFSEEERTTKNSPSWSVFSFFRRRIPTDDEVMQKEHSKKIAQERAEMNDDDENMQQKTPIVKTQVVDAEEDFEDYESIEHKANNTPKEKKGNFMSKLFNLTNKKEENEREDLAIQLQMQQQNINELKETIKILHRWLEKLPSDKISEFKRSPDFEKYKQGLRNLGLIKE